MIRSWSRPEAQDEFDDAVAYCEECEPGLGLEFADEVLATIGLILAFPRAWPILVEDVRRCQTRRFPYGVLYTVEDAGISILAVMHLHRNPDYWKQRRSRADSPSARSAGTGFP